MGFLDMMQRTEAPQPMMGRANFGIQRPSPRVRLDKFKATLDPRMMGQRNVEVTEDVQTPRENIDLSLDVNKDIPLGHDLPGAGGWSRPSGENMTQGEIARSGQPNSESQIANILAEISGIQGKDYGPRQKGGFKDVLLGLGIGALQGVASADPRGGIGAILGGALGGGAAGGIGGAVDGSTDNKMRDRMKLDRLYDDFGKAAKVRDIEQNAKYKKKQTENIDADNAARDAKDVATAAGKLRTDLIRQYNAFKEFDPEDPDNYEFVKAAQEAGVATPPKTAKTSFRYITDAKTGETYVNVTDEVGNSRLERVVNDDGTPLKTTTPQMMTAADKVEQRKLQKEIADNRNITSVRVAQIGAKRATDVANINQGGATTRANINSADKARSVIAAIENTAPKGSTPEQVKAKVDAFLQTLSPEVRKEIGK